MDNKAFEFDFIKTNELDKRFILNEEFIDDQVKEKKKFEQFKTSTSSLLTASDDSEFKIDDDSLIIGPNLISFEETTDYEDNISFLNRYLTEDSFLEDICSFEIKKIDIFHIKDFINQNKNKYKSNFRFKLN